VNNRLEVCCYSVEDARIAQHAGADRIELCAGRPEDGTTPSLGVLECARQEISIPVFPMVRPRGGDFVYGPDEFDAMCRDVRHIVDLGFPGFVTGVLTAGQRVDVERNAVLLESASGVPNVAVTFHKAFDLLDDQIAALDELAELGFQRVLTSGGAADVVAGLPQLERLLGVETPLTVMPGGGVRPSNVARLLQLGAREVHSSATLSSDLPTDAAMVAQLACEVHGRFG